MKSGFNFELYEEVFTNCFIEINKYLSGYLQLSLYGRDPKTNEIAHFTEITLDQNSIELKDDEVVVDNTYKPNFVSQLVDLGILKDRTGDCVINHAIFPVYTVDLKKINKMQYCMPKLMAA